MKTLYVTVKIVVQDDIDPNSFVEEVDYSFNGYGVIETEITDYNVKDEG